MRRGHRLRALIVLGLLVGTLLAGVAGADHTYTHRYLVVGRVIDADGEPVSGAPVTAVLKDVPVGPCQGYADGDTPFYAARTTTKGDFAICFHTHSVPEGTPIVVNASGERVTLVADHDLRRTVVHHRLGNVSDEKDSGAVQFFAYRYLVTGRVWRETGPVLVENIPANGTTPANEPVNVTLAIDGGRTHRQTARTDAYGDYVVEFRVDDAFMAATVSVAYGDAVVAAAADTAFRRSDVDVVLARSEADRMADALARGPPAGQAPPGTEAPAAGAAAALAAVAAVALASRQRAR